MKFNREMLIVAQTRAGMEHRHAGGTGPAPDELVHRHYARVRADFIERRAAESPAPVAPVAVEAPMPLLIDGCIDTKRFNVLRSVDGRECRSFAKGQRMADAFPHDNGGLDLDGFGRALAATISGNRRGNEAECRALSEGLNTGGGFFVSEALSSQIIDLARNKARVFEAGAAVLDMPTSDVRLVSVTEDPTISLVGENGLIPSDDMAFGSKLFAAKKHGVLIKCSNELLADGVGAGSAITNALASAWASYMDTLGLDFIFNESGVGETESVGALSFDDLLDAQAAVAALNGTATACILNSKTVAALSKLKEATTNAYLTPPKALVDSVRMLDSNAVADTHLLMGDFSNLVYGIRGGLSIELSKEAGDSFSYDQTWIRLLWRGDVNILHKHFHVLDGLTY